MANTPVNETLQAVLKRLEAANEGVSACRSGTTYLRMIEDPGALDALAELDSARRVARTALSADAAGTIAAARKPEWRTDIKNAPMDGTRIQALVETELVCEEHIPMLLMGGWKRVCDNDRIVGWRLPSSSSEDQQKAAAPNASGTARDVLADHAALYDEWLAKALALPCDDQHALATRIAGNIGYELVPEPDHPDTPPPGAFERAAEKAAATPTIADPDGESGR